MWPTCGGHVRCLMVRVGTKPDPSLNVLIGCWKHVYIYIKRMGWGGWPYATPKLVGWEIRNLDHFSTRNVGQICCIVELAVPPLSFKVKEPRFYIHYWPYRQESKSIFQSILLGILFCAYCSVNEFWLFVHYSWQCGFFIIILFSGNICFFFLV
jgi:hypothetical protein